jgi:hypothetical protein
MPGASFHSFYWAGSADPVAPDPPLGSSAGGGYVPWQTSVIAVISLCLLLCR